MSAASATPASATCNPPVALSMRFLLNAARAATSSAIAASSAPGQGKGASRGNDASWPSSRKQNVSAAPTEPGRKLSAVSASKGLRRSGAPGATEAVSCSWLKATSFSFRRVIEGRPKKRTAFFSLRDDAGRVGGKEALLQTASAICGRRTEDNASSPDAASSVYRRGGPRCAIRPETPHRSCSADRTTLGSSSEADCRWNGRSRHRSLARPCGRHRRGRGRASLRDPMVGLAPRDAAGLPLPRRDRPAPRDRRAHGVPEPRARTDPHRIPLAAHHRARTRLGGRGVTDLRARPTPLRRSLGQRRALPLDLARAARRRVSSRRGRPRGLCQRRGTRDARHLARRRHRRGLDAEPTPRGP